MLLSFKAQGLSRTFNEGKEEEEEAQGAATLNPDPCSSVRSRGGAGGERRSGEYESWSEWK